VLDGLAGLPEAVPIVANVGDNCTADSVAFARRVAALRSSSGSGVSALMVVTPYYNKPPQEGLYRHFRSIAEAVDLPVVLYNIPGRCVVNIEPETIIRLAADVPNIRALKQANPDLAQLEQILAKTPDDFEVFSGDDSLTLPLIAQGGVGVISTIGNIASTAMRAMIEAFVAGDRALAERYDEALRPLEDELFVTANPIMVKKALELRGFPVGGLRLPLIEADTAQTAQLQVVMDRAFETCAALSLGHRS
jgi:4-hydroxy-tetrahydrodipicolinate synthase